MYGYIEQITAKHIQVRCLYRGLRNDLPHATFYNLAVTIINSLINRSNYANVVRVAKTPPAHLPANTITQLVFTAA